MLPVWDLTVPTEMKRSLAISELVLPEASRFNTSRSRSLRGSSSCAPSRRGTLWPCSASAETLPCAWSHSRRAYAITPSSARGRRCPLRASSSSIFDASSTVSEVRMAAVAGVISRRSARACRSSPSLTLLSSDLSRPVLSSTESAIGTTEAKTGASHQKLVRGARTTHTQPEAIRYNADCQLTRDATSRFAFEPRALRSPLLLGARPSPSLVRCSGSTISHTCQGGSLFHDRMHSSTNGDSEEAGLRTFRLASPEVVRTYWPQVSRSTRTQFSCASFFSAASS